MNKTTFKITKMDCPSKEQMIRVKLETIESIQELQFDIPNRKLAVIHNGSFEFIEQFQVICFAQIRYDCGYLFYWKNRVFSPWSVLFAISLAKEMSLSF